MSFFARLLGRHGDSGTGKGLLSSGNKRQQPCSPPSGSFSPEFTSGRPTSPPLVPVKLQSAVQQQQQQQQQQRSSIDSDEEDCTIRVPGSLSCANERSRSNSIARRRAAIDISPRAVKMLSDKVALMDAGDGGVTRAPVEALYSDLQLLHRGRSSMVYRAREVRTGRRVILKAYDTHWLSNSTRRTALDRQICALRAAQTAGGPNSGLVLLERVVESPDGTFLVMQACNGGTLIEAIANSGGKLPERQVAIKVAVPLLAALKQLHGNGIVHRDIKPEHLMIHNGCLKMGDFGSAGCMTAAAAALASRLQQQDQQQQQQPPAAAGGRRPSADHQLDQQQLVQQLEQHQLQHQHMLHLQADCTAEAAAVGAPLCPKQDYEQARFGSLAVDTLSGQLSKQVSGPLAAAVLRDGMNFRIGSIEYMAPEMLNKPTAAEVFHLVIAQGIDEDDLPTYNEKVDIWSLGVVVYEALSGLQPFLADSAADMAALIHTKLAQRGEQEQLPAFVSRVSASADAKSFVAACLQPDPSKRPSAAELLSHPWLQRMQEEAAAVAAARASNRRLSLQRSRNSTEGGVQPQAAASPAAAAAAGELGTVSLVDPIIDSMLHVSHQNSLDLSAIGLERSQTSEQLEVGARGVLRTNTQRLDSSRARFTRVHAA